MDTSHHNPANGLSAPARRTLLLAAFLVALLGGKSAQAQLYVGLHGGATFPTGYYAESRLSEGEWMLSGGSQKYGGAGIGFSAGLEVAFAMPFHTNLEAFLTADYLQSSPNRDVTKYYEEFQTSRYGTGDNYTYTLPLFRNIPAMIGVRYAYPASRSIDFYAEAACGINYRMTTGFGYTIDAHNYTSPDGQHFERYYKRADYTYANSLTFAFRVGGGILVGKRFSVGATFSVLGKAPLSWECVHSSEYDYGGGATQNDDESKTAGGGSNYCLNPTVVTVSLGYRLPVWSGASRVQDF